MSERSEIEIAIRLEGEGFATHDELELRDVVEDWIKQQNLGEIVDAGSGLGFMNLAVEVGDAPAALALLESYITQLGIRDRTTLNIAI